MEEITRHKETQIRDLETRSRNLVGVVRQRDARIGELETHTRNLEEAARQRDARIGELETHARNLEEAVRQRNETLHAMYTSHGWKLLSLYYRMRDRLLPANSARRKAIKFLWNLLKRRPGDASRPLSIHNSFPLGVTRDAAPPEAQISRNMVRNSRLNSQFWRIERPLKHRCLVDAGELVADKGVLAEIITQIKNDLIESFEHGEHRE